MISSFQLPKITTYFFVAFYWSDAEYLGNFRVETSMLEVCIYRPGPNCQGKCDDGWCHVMHTAGLVKVWRWKLKNVIRRYDCIGVS
jgi:hypothetical protein